MIVDKHVFDETADALLEVLEHAQETDKDAEKKVKFFGCGALLCFFPLFFSVFIAIGMEIPAFLIVTAALAVGLVFCAVNAFKYRRLDLEDRKLEIPTQLLRILRADIPSREKVHLEIDFRDYRKHGERLDEQKGGLGKPRSAKYRHAWLGFETTLCDGSTLSVQVADRIARKEKPKRKYTKVKEKIASEVQIGVKLWKKYGEAQKRIAHTSDVAPPPPLKLKGVFPQGRKLTAVFTTDPLVRVHARHGLQASGEGNAVSGDALLQAIAWLYHGMGDAKQSA